MTIYTNVHRIVSLRLKAEDATMVGVKDYTTIEIVAVDTKGNEYHTTYFTHNRDIELDNIDFEVLCLTE